MRNRKTSLTYRLLRRHQNFGIISSYLLGQFLKTRKVTHNENENLFEHKTPCPGFTSKCLSNAQTAFRFSGLTILCNPLLIKPFIFVGEGITLDLPELTHPASPVGAPSNPGRSVGTMNQVNSTNRNLVAL